MFFEDMTNEEKEQTKKTVRFIGRFIKKYVTYLLFSLYIFYMPIFFTKDPFTGFYVTKSFVIIGIIISVFCFYTLNRLVTVYNDDIAYRFISSQEPITNLSGKIKFILAQKENRYDLILLAVIHFVIPLGATCPCVNWLFVGERNALIKFAVTLIYLGVLFLLYMLANLSSIKYWDTEERQNAIEREYYDKKSLKTIKKRERREYHRMFMGVVIGYYLGSFLLLFFFPQLISTVSPLLMLFVDPKVVIIAIVLIVAPFAIRYSKAYFKRKKFLTELKKICKQRRYILSKVKNPYKSLFKLFEGESFNVRIGDRKFSCKLISSPNRGRPLYILKKGIGAWFIQHKFLSIELFSYTKSFDFGWDADCKKVIIVNPVPQYVLTPRGTEIVPDDQSQYYLSPNKGSIKPLFMQLTKGGSAIELDNGDIIDGYEFYTATGFLNALERDVIDID